jgi:hypothetical protein
VPFLGRTSDTLSVLTVFLSHARWRFVVQVKGRTHACDYAFDLWEIGKTLHGYCEIKLHGQSSKRMADLDFSLERLAYFMYSPLAETP